MARTTLWYIGSAYRYFQLLPLLLPPVLLPPLRPPATTATPPPEEGVQATLATPAGATDSCQCCTRCELLKKGPRRLKNRALDHTRRHSLSTCTPRFRSVCVRSPPRPCVLNPPLTNSHNRERYYTVLSNTFKRIICHAFISY